MVVFHRRIRSGHPTHPTYPGHPGRRGAVLWVVAISIAMSIVHPIAATAAEAPVKRLPELVVSASRVPVPAKEIGSAVTVITGAELKQRQIRVVSDALRDVPGLAVSRTGPVGAFTQVRIRGAESNQTLVLIDRKSTRLNSSHIPLSRMPSSA